MTAPQVVAQPDAGNVIYLQRRAGAPRIVARRPASPTEAQSAWLQRGLGTPDGVLPLFDRNGQRIDERTVRICLRRGWATPWFRAPAVPEWLVCKLTAKGRAAVAAPVH